MQFKIFKKKKTFRKGAFTTKPSFFWMLTLIMMFAISIGSFLFGLFLFFKVNTDPVLTEEDLGGQVETVDREKLSHVLEYFSERYKKSIIILNSPSGVVDPSL